MEKTKFKNKILAFALCLCLMVGLLPIASTMVFAVDASGTDWSYTGTTLTISSNDATTSWRNDAAFTTSNSIGDVTTVVIEDGVTTIGSEAFKSCTSLTSVTIPDTITSIEYQAFQNCEKLQTIDLSNTSIRIISGDMFSGCESLISVTLPNGLREIWGTAFYDCKALQTITLPSTLTKIGEGAFENCEALTSITVPSGVTDIESYTFSGCMALTSVTLQGNVRRIGLKAFYATNFETITLPSTVLYINRLSFADNTSIKSIIIPAHVTDIGGDTFVGCTSLTDIYFEGNMPKMEGSSPSIPSSATVYYPSTATGWDTYAGTKQALPKVTYNLTSLTSNGGSSIVPSAIATPYTATFAVDGAVTTTHALPQNINIAMGGSPLASSAYSYNSTTGVLTITNSAITGDLEITAQARLKNTETDITAFTISGQVGTSVIDTTAHTVAVTMPYGTDLTALTPTITLSSGATINPTSGTQQDFTNAVDYTVTAENTSVTQNWAVTVTNEPLKITNGANQTVQQGQSISFTSNGDFGGYVDTEVTQSGKAPQTVHTAASGDNANASAVNGSITVTLTGTYTATLPVGTHSISINSAGGSATTTFTVVAPAPTPTPTPTLTDPAISPLTGVDGHTNPQTGNSSNIPLLITLMLVSALGLTALFLTRKKYLPIRKK